jgi:hypothetical protein
MICNEWESLLADFARSRSDGAASDQDDDCDVDSSDE